MHSVIAATLAILPSSSAYAEILRFAVAGNRRHLARSLNSKTDILADPHFDPNLDYQAVLACSNSTQPMMVFLDAVTTRPSLHHLRGQMQDTDCRVSRGYASRMDVGNKVPICIGVTFAGTIGHIR
jgi:hypothetical protein